MESLVLSGAPDAPIIANPGALYNFVVYLTFLPELQVVLSKPSNTGAPVLPSVFEAPSVCLLSLHFDVVDSPCVHSS